jgi:4-alpha-glucanotransferase
MSARDQISRLGQLYGIDPSYIDFWGRRRRVSVATERALLEAMGAAVGNEAEVAASLREAEARPWRRMLAPVRVIAPPEPLAITFTLPARLGNSAIEWTLLEETGQVHQGTLRPDELTPVGAAEVDGDSYRRWRMPLPSGLPHGYHRLAMAVRGGRQRHAGSLQLIVTPARCRQPAPGSRLWGLTAQLYGVRSARNWGMGDFTDLADLAEQAAGLGAAALGINPLHALFPADPTHISPYSPSSRLFLNVFYLDPEAVPDLTECREAQVMLGDASFRSELDQARAADLVDYPAVWRLKLRLLELLFESFLTRHLASSSARARAFREFRAEMGQALEQHTVFDALHEHALQTTGTWSWHHWPEPLRHPHSIEVAAFTREHRERIDFFAYLQWLADIQLGAAQARARAGMPIGLYQDIAVAVNPASAMAWANPGVSLSGLSVGAPPDWFNPHGQNWVLAPLSPVGLHEGAYALFAAALRHNMRHSGAVRIDHVMGLRRLFWIPEGGSPAEGAYVRYPFEDLVRIIALESERHRCLVIGEDLGTVPRGFRPAMRRAGLLSCRVLYFERAPGGGFVAPAAYPRQALVSVSTHDLPTLKGYWTCRDIRWRAMLQRFPDGDALQSTRAERERDRVLLLRALEQAGLLPPGIEPEAPPAEACEDLVVAIHRYLALTPGYLVMVQLEDAAGEEEQPNLPGTDGHPNWRRKLGPSLERLREEPVVRRIAAVMTAAGRSARR